MPDDKDIRTPKADRLVENAEETASFRANRINTLNRKMTEMENETQRKTRMMGDEISAISKTQKRAVTMLGQADAQLSGETAGELNTVISNIGRAVGAFGEGIKRVTVDTARATTGAVTQYGKAIGEDININKQNTVAMALSTATPIFGYFASKFMETDIFKGAAESIKENVKGAFSKGLSAIGGIFRRGKGGVGEEEISGEFIESELGAIKRSAEDIQTKMEAEAPKLQRGGYIRRGGMIEAHKAEVVMPIEKILEKIDETKKLTIAGKLSRLLETSSYRLHKIEVEMMRTPKEISKQIMSFKKFQMKTEKEMLASMTKTMLELKVAFVGTSSLFRISVQRFLLQHPLFRNLLKFSDLMRTVISTPLTFLFGIRGGYRGMAARAVRTNNVFLKSANILQLMYGTMMPKLDQMIEILNSQLKHMTGETVPAKPLKGTYTLFGKVREFMTTRSLQTMGESVFDMMVDSLGLDRTALSEAGITKLGDFLKPRQILGRMGVTREMAAGKIREAPTEKAEFMKKIADFVEGDKKHKTKQTEYFTTASIMDHKVFEKMRSNERVQKAVHKTQEVGNTWRKQSVQIAKKSHSALGKVGQGIRGLAKSFKKGLRELGKKFMRMGRWLGKRMGNWALKALTFVATMMSNVMRMGWRIIAPIAGFLGGGIMKMLGAGPMGMVKGALTLGGGALGGIAGGGMALVDMIRGVGKAKEWDVTKGAGAMGAMLGGTGEGTAGSVAWGAAKGGGIGMAVGSIIPGVGTVIGGAIGALAGGILGFIGGRKVAKAFDFIGKKIKEFVKAMWKIVTFPFKVTWKVIKGLAKGAWRVIKAPFKLAWRFVKWWVGQYWKMIKAPFKLIGMIWQKVKDKVTPGKLSPEAKEAMAKGFNKALSVIFFPFTAIKWLAKNVIDKVNKNIENLDEVIADAIYNIVAWPFRKIKKIWKTIKGKVTGKISSILGFGKKKGKPVEPKEMPVGGRGIYAGAFDAQTRMEAEKNRLAAESMRKSSAVIENAVAEGAKNMTTAVVNNTNIVSAYNAQLAATVGGTNIGGGQQGGAGGFSSGNDFASNVVNSDLQ